MAQLLCHGLLTSPRHHTCGPVVTSVSSVKKMTTAHKGHTKGMEGPDSQTEGNAKRKFKGDSRQELRSKDKILKEHRQKAKVQAFQKHRQVVRNKKRANRTKK